VVWAVGASKQLRQQVDPTLEKYLMPSSIYARNSAVARSVSDPSINYSPIPSSGETWSTPGITAKIVRQVTGMYSGA